MKIALSISKRLCVTIAFVMILAMISNAQVLNHRQGEVLIEIERGANPAFVIEKLSSNFRTEGFKAKQVAPLPMNIWKISFDFASVSEIEVLGYTKRIDNVYNAQRNHIITYRNTPDDTDFSQQWQYINLGDAGGVVDADLDADLAWDLATGGVTSSGDTIVACIIDGGLDPLHDDFGDNIWINYGEIPNNGIDDDGNGYIDDYRGWDTDAENDDIYQGGSHGTPVAGIVGAQGNNGIGVTGVNWDVKLMILRGGGDEADALAGYAYPYTMRKMYNDSDGAEGAFVVTTNASWGLDLGQPEDAPLWCNFYDSLGAVGIISIGATINDNVNVDVEGDLPTACTSDYLISVSNLGRDGAKIQGAGFGVESIDLGAFGEDTYTTSLGNNYGGFGGTSGAAPHVTGAVALAYSLPCDNLNEMYESDPAGAALFVRSSILGGTTVLPEYADFFATSGRLNLNNMMNIVANSCGGCPFPLSIEIQNIFLDTALVVWENPEGVSEYNLRYKDEASEEWNLIENATSPTILAGLTLCTDYEVQIQSNCGPDSLGNFSISRNFTTIGCCNNPAVPSANNAPDMVPEGALFVDWPAEGDYQDYILEYKYPSDTEWNVEELTDNSILIEGLGFCRLVQIRLTVNCITGATTEISDTLTAVTSCGPCTTLDYCDAPDVVTSGEWIAEVNIDGLAMVSGDDGGYRDNSGFYDIEVPFGREFEFKIKKGFGDVTFSEWVTAWIDFNGDGVFSDDEEFFDEGEATEIDIDTVLFFDQNFKPGYTKMRVGLVFLDPPVPCNGESGSSFGEYEDFCVNLVFDEPCDAELMIDSLVIMSTSADIFFTTIDTSIAYNVRYKQVEQSDEDWNTISVLDTMATLSDLEECGNYVVQVRAVCPVDTSGFGAVSDTFMTTGPSCMVSTNDIDFTPLIGVTPFPNPFVDAMNLKINAQISDQARIEIFDMSGKKIHSISTFVRTGEQVLSIPESSSWNGGIYFIRISAEGYMYSRKVIKIGS